MITVLLGAPGSGKTTWTMKNRTDKDYIYNIDAIRYVPGLDVGTYTDFHRKRAIWKVQEGFSLIADATHTIKAHRDVWRHLGDRLGLQTRIVLFDVPLTTLIEVQKHREFPVKRSVVVDHHRKLQLARHAIDREGWGAIEVITWK